MENIDKWVLINPKEKILTPNDWIWGDEMDSMYADPDHHRIIFENEWVRILELILLPGEKESLHTHKCPGVMVIDQTSAMRYYGEDNVPLFDVPMPLGNQKQIMWREPQGLHALENRGEKPCHAFRIEQKMINPDQFIKGE